jgi:DNA invertase Pin-like site-specific DNA recombinase
MKTVLYCRVSTADQTLEHQRVQAEAAGYRFDEVVVDHGISGVRTALRDRPEGKRLFDMLRQGDTLVVRWVDRLGRNYADVTDTIRQFIRRGVIVRTVINGLTFDGATQDPMQQAVISYLSRRPNRWRHQSQQYRRTAILGAAVGRCGFTDSR